LAKPISTTYNSPDYYADDGIHPNSQSTAQTGYSMKIEVREISISDGKWDELVRSSRQNFIFTSRDFLESWIRMDPDWHLLTLGCFDEDGRLVGGQAILHRKLFGIRIQRILNIFYAGTPVLSMETEESSEQRYAVLSELARITRKYFPYQRIEFHPSLVDVRPYLDNGWEALPQYTHTWDLNDLDAVLKGMHRKQKYVRKAQDLFDFSIEQGDEIIAEFLRLYTATMQKFGWQPTAGWKKAFFRQVAWLRERDLLRVYTGRTKTGELAGVTLYILSREDRTAICWLIGYGDELNSKELPTALDYFAAQNLASDFDTIDFGEGANPNLYAFKDSVGTNSIPFWLLTVGNDSILIRFVEFLRKARQSLIKLIP
jgi:hypothetical protein